MNPANEIQKVRTASAYRALRAVINVIGFFALLPACAGIAIVIIMVPEVGFQPIHVAILAGSALVALLAIALRQSLLLLVDIADIQLQSKVENARVPTLLAQLLRAYNVEPEA